MGKLLSVVVSVWPRPLRGGKAGGKIVIPLVSEDPLFKWIKGEREGEPPKIGSLPNRLMIKVEDGDAGMVARAAVKGLESAWIRVCDSVWEHFVKNSCLAGNGTKDIWDSQVGAFWEIMWTASNFNDERSLLARRKRWRTHSQSNEPGDKCTVMHDLQELSGFTKADRNAGADKQDAFWEQMRSARNLGPLDLRKDEKLCSVALVKRLFPRVSGDALGWDVDASRWPSTVYVAAVPWIRKTVCAEPKQASKYAENVKRHAGESVLTEFPYFNLDLGEECEEFSKLSANYFHRESLKDERRCPLLESSDNNRDCLVRQLEDLYNSEDENGLELNQPHSFYALLLADGDRLGKLVGELGGEAVGEALSIFTKKAAEIVKENDGVTVYAGGDDVLAMLPAQNALECAVSLSESYKDAFNHEQGATLSAAVVFAHIRLPLSTVIAEAHRLLGEEAKESNGRDSLAAGVMKSGGLNCQWVTTWMCSDANGDSVCALGHFNRLTEHMIMNAREPGLSSALVYSIRETVSSFCGWDRWRPGKWGVLPNGIDDIRKFLHAEIFRSLAARDGEGNGAQAEEITETVWNLLVRSSAKENGGGTEIGIDALLLARFLADSEYGETSS